jgi:hypothetical protein
MNDDNFTKHLLESIEPLPQDVYNYTKLDVEAADMFSLKAAYIRFLLNSVKRYKWIPFSRLRKDNNNNIWIANWLLEKIKKDTCDD